MTQVSVYIIAFNEAEKVRATIESVRWADEVVLIDSHSTDATAEIAHNLGARVVQVDFKGFGDLRNQALAACTHGWIFSLDADERCTPEAAAAVVAEMRAEYRELDSEAAEDRVGGRRLRGFDMNFYCLDLTNTAQVRTIETPTAVYLLLCQAEDREWERTAPVFAAMTASFVAGLPAAAAPESGPAARD